MEETKKRRTYDLQFKLEVLNYAKTASGRQTARKFNIDEKRVREWKLQENNLKNCVNANQQSGTVKKRKRLPGGGRKMVTPQLDSVLLDWIVEQRENGQRVSTKTIQIKAKSLFPTLQNQTKLQFKGSNGWMQKFLKRNHLSLHRRTTMVQKDPTELQVKLVSFIQYVSKLRQENNIPPDHIVAMNETSVFFDMVANTTVNPSGSTSVGLESAGHEKAQCTIVLAAKGDGMKLTPFVVFKESEQEVQKLQSAGVVVRSSTNGWMNQELTFDWLHQIYGQCTSPRRMLVWDSYRCHLSKEIQAEIKKFNSEVAVIPCGTAKYIQAPDVFWNKPFKEQLVHFYYHWLAGSDEMSCTESGNLRALSKEMILNWVKKSWETISTDLIKMSFKACALTTCVIGSEDDQIHCFKPGQLCFPARELLAQSRLNQTFSNLEFEEDEEEQWTNEVAIEESDVEEFSADEEEFMHSDEYEPSDSD